MVARDAARQINPNWPPAADKETLAYVKVCAPHLLTSANAPPTHPSDLVQGVAMNTSAFMLIRFFAQAPLSPLFRTDESFSVSSARKTTTSAPRSAS